jgi:signal transduction histidine kinase
MGGVESVVITQVFLVDWVLVSLSLFNALLLIWLGLTVLLNADRRSWGTWLAAAGLLLGALFFVSHTAIIGHELTVFGSQDLEGWWQLGWYPVVLAPLAWYLLTLWYVGFWENPGTRLRRWHRPWVPLLIAYPILLIILMNVARPLPTYLQLTELDFTGTTALAGVPILLLLYPPFGLLCILLPLDALRHPAPSQRMMGDLARQRARPWLMVATAILFVVAALLTGFIVWLAHEARTYTRPFPNQNAVRIVAEFDLLLEFLIGAVIICLGQAIVSYEIFTGHTLPRRGFFRQWRGTILFAAGTAGTIGYALNWHVLAVFRLLLTTIVMIGLYAFFGWRAFQHREELITRLRPFVVSQGTSGKIGFENAPSRANALFAAVCHDVLDTTRGFLIPLGALVPLAGPPLTYPRTTSLPTFELSPALFSRPDEIIVALDAAHYAGAIWGIPLWTERGLIGALLLGPKRNDGLYAREEIEIARASAERILETLAGEQIAQRLIHIQRRRFAETRVLDLRTRRTLHDDILPELHMIALQLSPHARNDPVVSSAIQSLTQIHHQVSDLIHTPGGLFVSDGHNGQLVQALRVMIDDEFAETFDSITWRTVTDKMDLDPLLHEVVYNAVREAVRNAALHGRGDQPERGLNLIVEIRRETAKLVVEVCDDGVGMASGPRYDMSHDTESSTGSGGGLMLHSTMLAISGGELSVESPAGGGTRVVISVPV